jgi:hypothetical protein
MSDKPPLESSHTSEIPERGGPRYVCGHGFKQELPAYRGVRIFEMNCGEVSCSLSLRDFFQPAYIQEWIDGALMCEGLDKWISLDGQALERAIAADKRTSPPNGSESPNSNTKT